VVLREVKDLEKGITHLHNCMARYNALIADNAGLKAQLVNDNFHLETKISHELKVMLQLGVSVCLCACTMSSLQAFKLVDRGAFRQKLIVHPQSHSIQTLDADNLLNMSTIASATVGMWGRLSAPSVCIYPHCQLQEVCVRSCLKG